MSHTMPANQFDLKAKAYTSKTLMSWLASTPGAAQRAGIANANLDNLSAQEAVRLGIFGHLPSHSGVPVNDQTAMLVGTVYACLSKLSGAVSQLPVHQYRLAAGGDRERLQPTPLWWMLNESPSPAWTAASWKEWIVRCVALRGDQHTEILRNGPQAIGLRVHHPDNARARRKGDRLVYDVHDPETGSTYGVDQDDMLHFTGFGFDGEKSLSAIQWAARNSIGNTLAAARFVGKTIGEGGMPQVALTYPNKMDPAQVQGLRDTFTSIYGGGEGRKLPLIMTEGGQAKELSISPVDMELLASMRFSKADICEALGVPPIIIGDSEKTSSWGTGVEQITIGWVRYSIKPMLARWEEELNRKLFRRAGQFLEFELAGLLRGDSKAQSEAFRAAVGGPGTGDGWMAVNEVRRLLNMSPIPGEEFNRPYRAQRDTASTTGATAP
jgi:HK97 family phage portal protein